jgi:Flp pilus assembly protein TadD
MPDPAVEELFSNVNWALSRGLPKRDLLAMLKKLVSTAASGSPEQRFAKIELAELIVREQPFRAARLASDVLAHGPDPRVYGLLGIAHSLLGSLRASRDAYEHAVALDPEHPAYRHNLGHLLDAGLDRPKEALVHLSAAFRAAPHEPALASSYAHALARAGQAARAVELLQRSLKWSNTDAVACVEAWRAGKPVPADLA